MRCRHCGGSVSKPHAYGTSEALVERDAARRELAEARAEMEKLRGALRGLAERWRPWQSRTKPRPRRTRTARALSTTPRTFGGWCGTCARYSPSARAQVPRDFQFVAVPSMPKDQAFMISAMKIENIGPETAPPKGEKP